MIIQTQHQITRYYRGRQGKKAAEMLFNAIEQLWGNSVCEIETKSIKGIQLHRLTIDNLTEDQYKSFYKTFNLNDGEISE